MESAVRAMNMLSGVIMLAAGTYIQVTLWPLLSFAVQGMIGITVLLYFFIQIDLGLKKEGKPYR